MHLKLDDIDYKIIYELLKDGRKSFADIAKVCKTTKGVIARRFKQMEAAEIIVGATIQNSLACYNKKMIAVISLYVEREKMDQVLNSLGKFPQIIQVVPFSADPLIMLTTVMEDSEEFHKLRQNLLNLSYVTNLESKFFLGTRNHPENLSVLGNNLKLAEGKKLTLKREIDRIDKLLIEKLAVNGRITFSELAKELGSNIATVSRRYERLWDNGYIRAVIRIDPRKIGYPGFAVLDVKFPKADINTLNALSEIADITQIQKTEGDFDYSIIVMLRDLEHLFVIQDRIRAISGFARIESNLAPLFSPWPTFREFKSTE